MAPSNPVRIKISVGFVHMLTIIKILVLLCALQVLCCFVIFSSLAMYVEYFKTFKRYYQLEGSPDVYFNGYFNKAQLLCSGFSVPQHFFVISSKYKQSQYNNAVIETTTPPWVLLHHCDTFTSVMYLYALLIWSFQLLDIAWPHPYGYTLLH